MDLTMYMSKPVNIPGRRDGIEEAARNVQVDNNTDNDSSFFGILLGVGVAACSVAYDILSDGPDKSFEHIACDAATRGIVAGGIGYVGSELFNENNNDKMGTVIATAAATTTLIGISHKVIKRVCTSESILEEDEKLYRENLTDEFSNSCIVGIDKAARHFFKGDADAINNADIDFAASLA